MALNAEIHRRIEREVLLERRSMELVAAPAGDGRLRPGIDHLGTRRMRGLVRGFVAPHAQIDGLRYQVRGIVRAVREVTVRAVDPAVGDVLRLGGALGLVEVAAHADGGLISAEQMRALRRVRLETGATGSSRFEMKRIQVR